MPHQVRTSETQSAIAHRRWFTVADAAGLLGMSKQTLWRRVRLGIIDLPTVDGQLVVPASWLERLRATDGLEPRQYLRKDRSHD